MSSHDAGGIEEFEEGRFRLVRAAGREIGVTRWRDQLYAISNVCAHQRGPLCRGFLSSRVTSPTPGVMEVEDEAPVIACPWHGWEFDLRSGRALCDERYAVRVYPVRVQRGRVLVDLPAGPG